uniref:Putative isac anti-complement n=1 Tax=Ixodes ricinus TaxID=34613 RepID=A0A0K8REY6_IXORI
MKTALTLCAFRGFLFFWKPVVLLTKKISVAKQLPKEDLYKHYYQNNTGIVRVSWYRNESSLESIYNCTLTNAFD